jgi:putative transposase
MPRQARHVPADVIHHVLNRAAGKMELFRHDDDYAAFVRVLVETLELTSIRLCGYCLMSTHWHLVLWPEQEGQLSRFMQRLTITHVRRWLENRHRVGQGSVYQGRYKSFPVQDDAHFATLMRYVHRNPVNAGIVKRAEDWKWSSLYSGVIPDVPRVPICAWPVGRRRDWVSWVNEPQTGKEEMALKRSMDHGRPYGSDVWAARMEKVMELGPLRPRGRPKQQREENEGAE